MVGRGVAGRCVRRTARDRQQPGCSFPVPPALFCVCCGRVVRASPCEVVECGNGPRTENAPCRP
eukprot:scaffold22052_cov39-Phaeocystis_antarctica.AAC.1